MSDEEVLDFLSHYGVQGMKWGVRRATNKASRLRLRNQGLSRRQARNTVRAQNHVDKMRMAATGRQGKVNVLRQLSNRAFANQHLSLTTVIRHPLSTKKASQLQLQKAQKMQQQISEGKKKVNAVLLRIGGVSIKDIDYSTT